MSIALVTKGVVSPQLSISIPISASTKPTKIFASTKPTKIAATVRVVP